MRGIKSWAGLEAAPASPTSRWPRGVQAHTRSRAPAFTLSLPKIANRTCDSHVLTPRSPQEACQMLSEEGAWPLAGGTDLLPNMKRQQMHPKTLVGLRRLRELRGLGGDPRQGVTIGAAATLAEVSSHPAILAGYPALARVAGLVATPIIRNMGTIGGNLCLDTRCNYYNQTFPWRQALGFCLKEAGEICQVAPGNDRCWAVSSSDTPPVAVALGAKLRLVSRRGERLLEAQEFYREDGIEYLNKAPDEIVTEVLLPPADGLKSTYRKLRRRGSFDFPILGVAVALRWEDGACRDVRIVLGAVASAPLRARGAEEALEGHPLTAEIIQEAAKRAYRLAKPLDNTDLVHYYRKQMIRVYVAEALAELAGLPPP
ncbi:MAG: FAD binding domain-containing protein [Dehalococcoidia bacterium]|nr:FAD binding domain-containing protein [Dehalococcoidia bacterium]